MRINIVTGFFLPVPPVMGGATEKIWYRLAEAFARAGHQVTFISRAWPGFAADETVNGVHHHRLRGADHTRWLPLNLWRDWRWGRRVGPALPAADVTLCNTVMLPLWLHRRYPHVGHVVPVMARMPKGQARYYRDVALVLSLSQAVTEALLRENPALANRIAPFPFPIDWLGQAGAARQRVRTPSPLTIGYVGRIHPEKGIELLLQAAVELTQRTDLPAWRVLVAGPMAVKAGGGGEDYVAGLTTRFGPRLGSRLTFLPPEFDPARLAARYAGIDVFCYPSIAETGETFGVAVAEAMASGCVPVVSQLPCFRELVLSGDTGFTFDHSAPDAPQRLAGQLVTLLRDTELRSTVGARAQLHVRQFDFDAVAKNLLEHLAALPVRPDRKSLAQASALRH